MKLSEAKNKYLRAHKLKGSTPKTIKGYSEFIGGFIKYTGDIDTIDFTIEIVEDYQEMLFDRSLSKATIATYLRHIKAFVHWIEENYPNDIKSMYKRIKLPRKSKKVLKLFSSDEIERLFSAINTEPEWIRVRNCSIIALMLDSGLRQQEVCTLMIEDINFSANTIKVHGKGDKERFVPLGKTTSEYISEYITLCPYKNKYLFNSKEGTQITTNTVKLFVSKLKKKTELNFSSHKLRHNFATNYCLDMYNKNGYIDIYKLMVIMGHEDIETTRIYLHLANQYIALTDHISHLDMLSNA